MRQASVKIPVWPNGDRGLHGIRRETKRFEALVDDLSAAMARVTADAVDGEIDLWQGKICEALDLDRSGIYERDAPGIPVRTTHTWTRPKITPFPPDFNPEKQLKSTVDWVLAGKPIVFSSPSQIPAELFAAIPFIERYGPKASAIMPMWAGDQVIGGASFGRFRSSREWPPDLLVQLSLAVRLFGSAIERKQAEVERRAARAQLWVASRRNMMSEVVASLAHEINQPLGAILSNLGGLARLLGRNNPDPALALAAVNNAIEDTKRAAEIIRRVRFMFKAHPEHKTPLAIGDLANEVVSLIASEAALRQVQVQIEVSPAVKRVIGDRIQLHQCMLNLLMNALDAVAENKSSHREVAIRIAPEQAGWVGVSVSDNGIGIDPSIAGQLFEPFVTTKPKGMGLGLLVTRSIVENHGGKVWPAPNSGGGTTFTFTLPAAERKRTATPRAAFKAQDSTR
jgi:signal transduction histidine kinase